MSDQDLLRAAGELLYGAEWQSPLARDLEVAVRTLQRWAGGRYQLPASVWADIAALLEKRADELTTMPAKCRVMAATLRERADR